jgi:Ca-activated chloride channel family protein
MDRSINRSAQALARFIETSHDQDDFFLVTFAGRAAIAQDLSRGDPGSMLNRLASVRPSGQTALYDAVLLALDQVKQGPHARRALLVISDGRDNHSDHTFSDLRSAVRESGVIIYAVGITANSNDRQPDVGRLVLTQIAESSGGRAFFPVAYDEAGTAQDCARIALELRHQYSLGFYPTRTPGTTRYHRVRVKLDAPKDLGRLSLSYRTTYPSFKSPDIGKALDIPSAHPEAQ